MTAVSIIVPVYDRPAAVDALLASLAASSQGPYEVIVVDDGSGNRCEEVCTQYADALPLHYFFIPSSGPGPARNYGAKHATGDYFLFLDSDVRVPCAFLHHLTAFLSGTSCAACGGPDCAVPSSSYVEQAISYTMTSRLTTGGIRGAKGRKMDMFFPRSYNMCVSKTAFNAVGGFANMRYGEDIDLSLRLVEGGYTCCLCAEAWVWHARRTSFCSFFLQTYHSGAARIALRRKHPGSMKLVHCLPAIGTVGGGLLVVAALVSLFFAPWYSLLFLSPLLLFAVVLALSAAVSTRSLAVAIVSVAAAAVQLTGYGVGFLVASFSSSQHN